METPTPKASANKVVKGVNAIAPGRLLTYSEFTVEATMPTAPAASRRPSNTPPSDPASPRQTDSPRNASRTPPRVAPKARSTPISVLRRTTDTDMEL